MDFIVVDVYSSILARSWLHALGAISYTLHVKVKYPAEVRLGELLGCQTMARQCMVVAVRYQKL